MTKRRLVLTAAANPWTLYLDRTHNADAMHPTTSEDLPFADEEFEHIDAIGWIEHLKWPRWALQEAGRILVPGGSLRVRSIRHHSLLHLLIWGSNRFRYQRGSQQWGLKCPHFLAGHEIRALAPDAGFELTTHCIADDQYIAADCIRDLTLLERAIGVTDWWFRKPHRKQIADRREFLSSHQLAKRVRANFGGWKARAPSLAPRPSDEHVPSIAHGPVLVLAPHPDDELIGCGGTLLRYVAIGASVHVLFMTPGATCVALRDHPTAYAQEIRYQEAERVAEQAGFHAHFWRSVPCPFECNESLVRMLQTLVGHVQPQLIFSPSQADMHPEHRVAWRILAEVFRLGATKARVFEYPVWGGIAYNRHVDVTTIHDHQMRLLMHYRTAMKAVDYVATCTLLQSLHGTTIAKRPAYIEVFREWPKT